MSVHKAIAILKEFSGVVESASEDEITHAWLTGDRHGLYADPQTGSRWPPSVACARLARSTG